MKLSIDKKTGTYADTLHAVGMATLAHELGLGTIHLQDEGGSYIISTSNELPPEEWCPVSPGYPYVWLSSDKKDQPRPVLPIVLDYENERQKNERRKAFEKSQGKSKKNKVTVPDGVEVPEKSSAQYFTAAILASMRSGWTADKQLARWIEEHPDKADSWVRAELVGTAYPDNLPEISNSQIFNPVSGKGRTAAKSTLSSPGSLPDALVDPFSEWMKFRGLWEAMLLYRSGDDFKLFAIEPADIRLDRLDLLKHDLQAQSLWGGVRLDIRAIFECVRQLLLKSEAFESGSTSIFGRSPRAVVRGLRSAFFKSLGQGVALMNESLLPLPDWFVIHSTTDVENYLRVIDETIGATGDPKDRGCLGSLVEDHSDDGEILQQYRAWLLTGSLFELLEFHFRFAVHVMQRRSRNDYVREFQTAILDILFGRAFPREPQVKEIIENDGFLSVARAIRDSTIYAELKNRTVHFGLAQKWKQKLKAGDSEFLAAVGDFVQDQNWEVQYRLKGRGHVVLTNHLDDIVRLVQSYGAELVGSLLLAYGYARPPKADKEPEQEQVQ